MPGLLGLQFGLNRLQVLCGRGKPGFQAQCLAIGHDGFPFPPQLLQDHTPQVVGVGQGRVALKRGIACLQGLLVLEIVLKGIGLLKMLLGLLRLRSGLKGLQVFYGSAKAGL